MRPILRRLAFFALPALILMLPASASAFPLSNCTLAINSFDAGGGPLDMATVNATDATQENPFLVDWDGTVRWAGTMGPLVIMDHSWGVSVFNVPTPLRGGDPNHGGDTDGDGTVTVKDTMPFRVTGLFFVSGSISGNGGSCSGSGWMQLTGDPVGTIPFFVGLALLVLGLALLYTGYRSGWGWAILGGLLFGLGAALMLVIYALMLVGSWTPLTALVVGIGLGVVVIVVRRRRAVAVVA